MRQIGQAEHVLHRVDGEADVGAVLGVGGGGEELNEIDGLRDQLTAVHGVDGGGPVRVGPRKHERAEGGRVVDDRADVDRRARQAVGDLGVVGRLDDALAVTPIGVAAVNAVVPGDDDVVEVEVDGHAGVLRVGHASSVTGGAVRRGPPSLRSAPARVHEADLPADLVEGAHDRDRLVDGQDVAARLPSATSRSAAKAWYCIPRLTTSDAYDSRTVPSGATTRNDVGAVPDVVDVDARLGAEDRGRVRAARREDEKVVAS